MNVVRSTHARTDPEDPLAIPAAPIVEWFRVDATRRIAKFLAIGATGMVAGSLSIARLVMTAPHVVRYASRSPTRYPVIWPATTLEPSTVAWAVLGFSLVVGCGLVAVLGLRRVLSEESYLALRVDGVLFEHGEARRFARWEDVDDVRHDAERDALVIALRGDDAPWTIESRFAGASNAEIAKKAVTVRRRALFGMYDRRR